MMLLKNSFLGKRTLSLGLLRQRNKWPYQSLINWLIDWLLNILGKEILLENLRNTIETLTQLQLIELSDT